MKKLLLIVSVVLLALTVAACEDSFESGEQPQVYYDENGNASVELTIGISKGSSRAMNNTLAQAGTDFYEVIFLSPQNDGATTPAIVPNKYNVSRISWREGKVAKVRVDLGSDETTGVNYDNPAGATLATALTLDHGFAYIFAGRYSDGTLLGVGTIKSVNGSTTKVINKATTNVMFEIEPLTCDIYGTDGTNGDLKYVDVGGNIVKEISIDDKNAYAFILASTPPSEFTLDFHVGTAGLNRAFDYTTGTATVDSKAYIYEADDRSPVTLPAITPVAFNPLVPIGPGVTDSRSRLSFTITPPTAASAGDPVPQGLSKIYYTIPLILFNASGTGNSAADALSGFNLVDGTAAFTDWAIRGGLNNKLLDMGTLNMSLGGAILIATNDAFKDAAPGRIQIGAEYKP